jgi:hypothetical protein
MCAASVNKCIGSKFLIQCNAVGENLLNFENIVGYFYSATVEPA